MYKLLKPDKDTYITDRVVKGTRMTSANVGGAGSLDLFKLYGFTSSGSLANVELSRLLIHYDLQPLRDLVARGKIDVNNPSFTCTLKLFDVYGGQPTPSNFTVAVHPLSRSFDEGLGRDIVYYADNDVCNFLSGSRLAGAWLLSGCAAGGGIPGTVDYITASTQIGSGIALKATQRFITGEENLEVDVTTIVSATLAGLLPDEGFRVAFDSVLETDTRSYFVKRFAARTAFNEDVRPRLLVGFDDSIQDDSTALMFDSRASIFLYNYAQQAPANLTSGSSLAPVVGQNSIILKLATEVSGGWYTLVFTGSQHTRGSVPVTGIYSASVLIPSSDQVLAAKLAVSGSVNLTPIWGSLDDTVNYLTGSTVVVHRSQRGSTTVDNRRLIVTVNGLRDSYFSDETTVLRVNLFDTTNPLFTATRLPIERPGTVIRDVHFQVRDAVTGIVEVPFDVEKNSTRLSSDSNGMYFQFDMSNLTNERSYVIDVLVLTGNNRQLYKNASPVFRISDMR